MACEYNQAIVCVCHVLSCPRHGKCCECVAHHQPAGEFPGCFFSEAAEKNGRDFDTLLQDRGVIA